MGKVLAPLAVFVCLLAIPVSAFAQASITGVVRDTSGAVLPGVTVEAASPALIEKVRSATTDGNGQYRIVDLRPGAYAVSFSLPGFATVQRTGIELTGSFTATVNADMRVGGLEETITVTGASPIVDVQSATKQQVIDKDLADALPSSRTHFSLAALIPAINTSNPTDVGGSNAIQLIQLTAHGSRNADQRIVIEGMSTDNAEGAGQYSAYLPNMSSTQEMAINYSGGTAEMTTGGVQINVIPRDGGNNFSGTFFANGISGEWMQGSNYDQDLKDRGMQRPNNIRKIWDVNPGGGGPILRDKIWWYAAYRNNGESSYAGGYYNKNVGLADVWKYEPDQTKPTFNWHQQRSTNARMTWQITPTHKFSAFYDEQDRCMCFSAISATTAPEAGSDLQYPFSDLITLTWNHTPTSRLLFEAGGSLHPERWRSVSTTWEGGDGPLNNLIGVTDQATGQNFHGRTTPYATFINVIENVRGSMSYVTGSHSLKVGIMDRHATRDREEAANPQGLYYRFNNGVPNQITQRLMPRRFLGTIGLEMGVFAQDRWTVGKLTANFGVRWDWQTMYYPPQTQGPTVFTPDLQLQFPKTDWVNWKDLSPRLGVAYDLFGNGRTAVKASLNRYMGAFGLQGVFGDGSNPILRISNNVTRSWNDSFYPAGDPRNGNYVPDCDLRSPAGNAECGPMSDQAFGKLATLQIDPDVLTGWNKRGNSWELSGGVQHQFGSRVAAEVAYYRRWYGNFLAVDNRATGSGDYDRYTVTAPADSRLPDGGGYAVGPLYDLKPGLVGIVDDYITFASNYGKHTEYWHGVDISMNSRFANGVFLQGGTSIGRTVTDNCEIVGKSPEIISGVDVASGTATVPRSSAQVTGTPYCHQAAKVQPGLSVLGSYTVPRIAVQTSLTFKSSSGPAINANYVATNAIVSPSLGRNLTGATNATVNLVEPNTVFGDRVNSVDLRISKLLRFRATRSALSLDVYNLFNRNPVQVYNNAYASWLRPERTLQARFIKLGVQFDF
ncbi:MAG: TonB-dependent receptor [Vicinamibacterales bacterium]